MKLKELKENVVVDIKSEKQCHVLMNLLENAGYPTFTQRFSYPSGYFLKVVEIYPADKNYIALYGGKYNYIEPVNDLVKIDNEIIKDSIVYYGKDVQSTVCMEECAELIQAISKEKRGKSDKNNLAEEMADVLISIELLKEIYDVSNEQINEWVDKKQKRIRLQMK